MTRMFRSLTAFICLADALLAQPARPIQAQSSSTITSSTAAGGSQTVQIRNVSYEVTGTNVPGRSPNERLRLRKTTSSKQVLGDIGMEATVTLEAWCFGDDPRQKPLYSYTLDGEDGRTKDNALFGVSRGLEEVQWWSMYKLGSGQHLFDTYVPLVSFSISRETLATRYAGLEVPPDDTTDARLKQPNVVAVLSYASEGRVLREALLTSDNRKQARLLRSYADVTRMLSSEETPTRAIKVRFRQNYPSPPNPVELLIPVKGDDLDLANAKLPPKMRAAAWKR